MRARAAGDEDAFGEGFALAVHAFDVCVGLCLCLCLCLCFIGALVEQDVIYDEIRIQIQKSASRGKILSIPKVGVETVQDKRERERGYARGFSNHTKNANWAACAAMETNKTG